MKIRNKILLLTVVMSMLFVTACNKEDVELSAKDILKEAVHELNDLDSYRIDANSKYDGNITINGHNVDAQVYTEGFANIDYITWVAYFETFAKGNIFNYSSEEHVKEYDVIKDYELMFYTSVNDSVWNKLVIDSNGNIKKNNKKIAEMDNNIKLSIGSLNNLTTKMEDILLEDKNIGFNNTREERSTNGEDCYVIDADITGEALEVLSKRMFVQKGRTGITNYDGLQLKTRWYISKDKNKLIKVELDVRDIMKDVIYAPDKYETSFDFNEALIELNYSNFNNVSVTLPEELNKL